MNHRIQRGDRVIITKLSEYKGIRGTVISKSGFVAFVKIPSGNRYFKLDTVDLDVQYYREKRLNELLDLT